MRAISLLCCTLLVAGCYPQADTTEADVEAITAVFVEFDAAVAAGDADRILALYADDVVSMPPNSPARIGVDTMRAQMQEFADQYTSELTSRVEEVEVAGDIAFALVSWEQTTTPTAEGDATHEQGKWIVVFKRQADGSWKCWREMWSTYEPAEM
jgi:uncharacterized protein (TIGR02246 family)